LVEAYKGMEEYVQSVHKRVFSRDFMPFQLHLHNSLICTQINVKSEADRTKGTSYIMLFKVIIICANIVQILLLKERFRVL
jgi:hypothetical protein